MGSLVFFTGFCVEKLVPESWIYVSVIEFNVYQVECLKEYIYLFQYFFHYVEIKIKIQYSSY